MNKNLIVVDVQPFYHNWHEWLTPRLTKYINRTDYDNILYFFNGEEMGIPDTVEELNWYLVEWGLNEERIPDLFYIEKNYSFFRGWMDIGIDEDFIVYIVKYMLKVDLYDSRDIDEDDLDYLLEKFYGMTVKELADIKYRLDSEAIMIPNWDYSKLKEFDHYDLCGGGRDECLKEIEILLQALDLKYNILNNLVY